MLAVRLRMQCYSHIFSVLAIYIARMLKKQCKRNKDNTHPWIHCVGTVCNKLSSTVLVCQRKVITKEIGKSVSSALLLLLAVHYTYELFR